MSNRGDDEAYPVPNNVAWNKEKNTACAGMTIRERFAMAAMQGILAGNHPITRERDAEIVTARAAVSFADALLAALGGRDGKG